MLEYYTQSRHGALCVFALNVSGLLPVESIWVAAIRLAPRVAHDRSFLTNTDQQTLL